MTVFEMIKQGVFTRLQAQRELEKECFKYGYELEKKTDFHWMSKDFLVQVFEEEDVVRISVNRTKINKAGTSWCDRITWDDLQRIKDEIGFSDRCAVEIYPPKEKIVNDANMRHLWVLPKGKEPDFMWTEKNRLGNGINK